MKYGFLEGVKVIHVLGVAGQEGRAVFDWLMARAPHIRIIGHEGCSRENFKEVFMRFSDAYSESESSGMLARFLSDMAEIRFGADYLSGINEGDLVIAPQAYRRYAGNAPVIEMAKEGKIEIMQAMELVMEITPCMTIGVTGSAGKSSVMALIAGMIRASGHPSYISGNDREDKWDLFALEAIPSSGVALFEISHRHLMDLKKSPDVAVLTNIHPHHLDDAGSFENYIAIKKNIFIHQSHSGSAIINKSLIDSGMVFKKEIRGKLYDFSGGDDSASAFLKNGLVVVRKGMEEIGISKVPYGMNPENVLASALAGISAGFSLSAVREGINNFSSLKYRKELVHQTDKLRFINDGKSSDPAFTIETIRMIPDIDVLILGGIREGGVPGDFAALAEEIRRQNIRHVVIYGRSAEDIHRDLSAVFNGAGPDMFAFPAFSDAMEKMAEIATSGNIVLSPACQSLDQFADYRARAESFNSFVKSRF